ncbi:MAG TPA: hypothetical protein VJ885_14540, partial [Thermoanaerobaculia bacterium]|nr:hypothetical protein [Thermoanaerobaculia bacterium]
MDAEILLHSLLELDRRQGVEPQARQRLIPPHRARRQAENLREAFAQPSFDALAGVHRFRIGQSGRRGGGGQSALPHRW